MSSDPLARRAQSALNATQRIAPSRTAGGSSEGYYIGITTVKRKCERGGAGGKGRQVCAKSVGKTLS
jgi:hypothetical protein